MSQFTVPGASRTWIFMDECPDSINDGLMEIIMTGYPSSPPPAWADVVSSLHNGGGALTFADGHCEVHKWRDGNSKLAVVKQVNCPAYTKGLSSPNDYRWLQERTSAPL
jgi:prepilin-type processing-associated H-X9-DG protein